MIAEDRVELHSGGVSLVARLGVSGAQEAELHALVADLDLGRRAGLPGSADDDALLIGEALRSTFLDDRHRLALAHLGSTPLGLEVAPRWEALPWMTLFPPAPPGSPPGPLVYRSVDVVPVAPALRAARVLLVLGGLDGAHPLEAAQEQAAIQGAVEGLPVAVHTLPRLHLGELREAVEALRPAVVHVFGHGVAGALRTGDGARRVDGEALWDDALSAAPPALVVLAACRSAEASPGAEGVAAALARAGVPAVVGTTSVVGDRYLRRFTTHLYRAWFAEHASAVEAMERARVAVDAEHRKERDAEPNARGNLGWWSAPELWTANPDPPPPTLTPVDADTRRPVGSIGDLRAIAAAQGEEVWLVAPWGYPVEDIAAGAPPGRRWVPAHAAPDPSREGTRALVFLPGCTELELEVSAQRRLRLGRMDRWSLGEVVARARGNPRFLDAVDAALAEGATVDAACARAERRLGEGRPQADFRLDPVDEAVIDALLPAGRGVRRANLEALLSRSGALPDPAALTGSLGRLVARGILSADRSTDAPDVHLRAPPWAAGRSPTPSAATALAAILEADPAPPDAVGTLAEALRLRPPTPDANGAARVMRLAALLREGFDAEAEGALLDSALARWDPPPPSWAPVRLARATLHHLQDRRAEADAAYRALGQMPAGAEAWRGAESLGNIQTALDTVGFSMDAGVPGDANSRPPEGVRLALLLAGGRRGDAAAWMLSRAQHAEGLSQARVAALWRARVVRLARPDAGGREAAGRLAFAARLALLGNAPSRDEWVAAAMAGLVRAGGPGEAALQLGTQLRYGVWSDDEVVRAAWRDQASTCFGVAARAEHEPTRRAGATERAWLALEAGREPDAEELARGAADAPGAWPQTRAEARLVLAWVADRQSRWAEALRHADLVWIHAPAEPLRTRLTAGLLGARARAHLLASAPEPVRRAGLERVAREVEGWIAQHGGSPDLPDDLAHAVARELRRAGAAQPVGPTRG